MTRAFGLRLGLTVLALGCALSAALNGLGFVPGADFPVHLVHARSDRYRVEPRNGQVLPAGLEAGDLIPIGQLAPALRVLLLRNRDVPPGTIIHIPLERSGRGLQVTLQPRLDTVPLLARVQFVVFLTVMLAITLLTLWRGRDWAAWALSAMFLTVLLRKGLLELPAALPWLVLLHQARALTGLLIEMPALFILADALAGRSLQPRHRRAARIICAALIALMLIAFELGDLPLVLEGTRVLPVLAHALPVFALTVFGLTLLVLITGYRRAEHQERLRIRWVLWSTALLGVTSIVFVAMNNARHPYLYQALIMAQGLSLVGYLYAVLRTRLIDVGFVIDRALVFGLLTALVFGTFSILEETLHQFAVSDRLGWALQALVALILAVALSPLHRRLESWIEQAFFRAQRLALLALERFARECPYVEREAHLLEMTIERLRGHCGTVALYERSAKCYRRRAASDQSWPAQIDADDPVFVALRATHEPVALAAQANRVGTEGIALPMTVAESLLGALVCRPRDGEQFAPEVREALANVAHHLGMALTGLRHREHARLVADVAAGRIDPDAARRRAMSLMDSEPPQINAGV
ncbi:MAG: hypothetical protein ACYCT1_02450 [Steroidobacteraceae bacterium]